MTGQRCRGVLPLCQAVDPVVEQDDFQVDVAPQAVQQVIAPDRQPVTVPGDDPDTQVGIDRFKSGRDGRRPAVN